VWFILCRLGSKRDGLCDVVLGLESACLSHRLWFFRCDVSFILGSDFLCLHCFMCVFSHLSLTVYDLRFVVSGVWPVAHSFWFIMCLLYSIACCWSLIVYGLLFIACDVSLMSYGVYLIVHRSVFISLGVLMMTHGLLFFVYRVSFTVHRVCCMT